MLRQPARRARSVDAEARGKTSPNVAMRGSALCVLLAVAPLLAGTGCSSSAPDSSPAPAATTAARAAAPASSADDRVRMAATPGIPACHPDQLALVLDAGNGRFDGMSHSGTRLLLRNAGARACTIPVRPTLQFADAGGHALDIVVQASADAEAKRKPAPVTIAPGDSVDSDLRWVSGNVYENGHCEAPARIRLALDGGMVYAAFAGHLCGAGGKPSLVSMTPFAEPATHG